jgi:hypothetical protein
MIVLEFERRFQDLSSSYVVPVCRGIGAGSSGYEEGNE